MRSPDRSRTRPAWWTVPNLVTAIRFALIAPIVALLLWAAQPIGAAVLTAVFGASDWVDGFLARKLDQVSRTGEILDPLADRAGIGCIAIALAVAGAAPLWLICVFPAVDLTVSSVYLLRGRGRPVAVSRVGKVRTGLTMASVLVVMVGMAPGPDLIERIGSAGLAAGAALHVCAGAGYLRQMLR